MMCRFGNDHCENEIIYDCYNERGVGIEYRTITLGNSVHFVSANSFFDPLGTGFLIHCSHVSAMNR